MGDWKRAVTQLKVAAELDEAELHSELLRYANSFEKVQKRHHQHVRKGREAGQNWETEIPVTDPMSLRALERNSRGIPGNRK